MIKDTYQTQYFYIHTTTTTIIYNQKRFQHLFILE